MCGGVCVGQSRCRRRREEAVPASRRDGTKNKVVGPRGQAILIPKAAGGAWVEGKGVEGSAVLLGATWG